LCESRLEPENEAESVPWLAPEQMKPMAAVTGAADVFVTALARSLR
jgi:hypothetical protein